MKWWQALTGFFGQGKDPLGAIMGGIDKLSTSGEEAMKVKTDLIKTVVSAQASVLVAEAQSQSWLTRSWRPLVMLSFASILIYTFFVGPMWNLRTVDVPQDLWMLMKVGIGGYVGGRTVEKLVEIIPKRRKKQGGDS